MKCAFSRCTILVTILFTLKRPTQIGCCSHNTNDMITLMHQNPDYRQDPCYIQWKADQDAKLSRLFAERDQLERSMAEYNRIREANRIQEQKNRQNSYFSTSKVEKKKESAPVLKVLGIIAGVIVGIFCCLACFSSEKNATTNNLQTDPSASVAVSPVPMVTSYTGDNRTIPETSTINDNNYSNVILPEIEGQPETIVPLLPREMIKRQDSLPSYDDALRMPSAPPKE